MDEIFEKTKNKNSNALEGAEIHSDILHMKPRINNFIEMLKGQKILDVGCGQGIYTEYFSNNGFDVTGIDISLSFIEQASIQFPKAKFMQMDMRKMDFADEAFDGLWVCSSFLHLPKKDALETLREFRRIMETKGAIFLSVKLGEGENFLGNDERGKRFFSYYTQEEILELFEAAELKVTKIEVDSGKEWISIFAIKS